MHDPSPATTAVVEPRAGATAPAAPLLDRLDATRRAWDAFARSRRLLLAALALLILAVLLGLADYLWELTLAARAFGLTLLAASAFALLRRGRHAARAAAPRDAAAEVEAAFPQLGQRVRTTLDYSLPDAAPAPAAPGLVRALTTDTVERTRPLDFRHLVPWRSLAPVALALAAATVAILAGLVLNPELRTAARRLVLLPAAYTSLAVEPGDHTLKEGEDLTVTATVTGRPVRAATLFSRPAGSADDWTARPLGTNADDTGGQPAPLVAGALETPFKNCRTDFDYRVVAGRLESPTYHITVVHPLKLEKLEATVIPPPYTRRPTTTGTDGNLKVIEGSTVRLAATLDRQPATAALKLTFQGAPPAEAPPPVPVTIEGRELRAEIPDVTRDLDYELTAESADGMRLDNARFRVTVQPDRPPTVTILHPEERAEVLATSEVNFQVEAADDFGLARVGLTYQVGSGPWKTLWLKEDPAQPTSFRGSPLLALEDLGLAFPDGITYHAFAEDNHPTRPRRAVSELRFLDVRPYQRAYQRVESSGEC